MLQGRRIFLRRFRESDAPLILRWGQNERYKRLAGFASYSSLAQARQAAQIYARRKYSYLICLKKSKRAMGMVELYERGMDKRSGLLQTKSLGFLLDQDFEGRGYMSEALGVIFDFAFGKLRQKEVWANTFADNERSQHLLLKLGFRYVYQVDYSRVSSLFSYTDKYYLLKKGDWARIRKSAES